MEPILAMLSLPSGAFVDRLGLHCAVTCLLQIENVGLATCDITSIFQQDPNEFQDPPSVIARRKMIKLVRAKMKGLGLWTEYFGPKFVPVLYSYDLYQGEPTLSLFPQHPFKESLHKRGHMVWTDASLTRFLLVNLYGPTDDCRCHLYVEDTMYVEAVRFQAQRFLNLATYIGSTRRPTERKPKWVRATYTTRDQPDVDPAFFSNLISDGPPAGADPAKYAPIIHLAYEDMVPSLRARDLTSIDCIYGKCGNREIGVLMPEKIKRGRCAACHSTAGKLMQCSRCHRAQYCGRNCQKDHWKTHKFFCKVETKDDTKNVEKMAAGH